MHNSIKMWYNIQIENEQCGIRQKRIYAVLEHGEIFFGLFQRAKACERDGAKQNRACSKLKGKAEPGLQ